MTAPSAARYCGAGATVPAIDGCAAECGHSVPNQHPGARPPQRVYDNASLGDALFSGTPSGAGGVTISAGADNYRGFDHNWVAGN